MVPVLILGVALLVGLFLIGRWYVQADPKQVVKLLRYVAVLLAVFFVLVIALSGRWGLLPALIFFVLPWLSRLRAVSTFAKNMRGPSPGQTSQVETRLIRMALDHDTGDMDGEVLGGTYAGRHLSDMALAELVALWREAADDPQSQAVITAYLDRVHGDAWRAGAGAGPADGASEGPSAASASPDAMTVQEACDILGVAPGAKAEEIERAYRRLMLKMHPDQGGSDWLAAKINQAKDLLLND